MLEPGGPTDNALRTASRTAGGLAIFFTCGALTLYVVALLDEGLTLAPLAGVGASGQLLAAGALLLLRWQLGRVRHWYYAERDAATQHRRS